MAILKRKYLFPGLILFAFLLSWAIKFIWFKPLFINGLFTRVVMEYGWHNPEGLSYARIFEPYGIKFHQKYLNDISDNFFDRYYARAHQNVNYLRSYDDDLLDESALLSKQILESYLQDQIDGERFRYHGYPFNQMFGLQSAFPSFMKSHHLIYTLGDAEDYIERLNRAPVKFDQALNRVKISESLGILPPRFVIDRILEQMRQFIKQPTQDNVLYTGISEKLLASDLNHAQQQALLRAAEDSINHRVFPAYQKLIDYFSELASKANQDDGVWKHPDGDAYYRYLIRHHTTSNLGPQAIHELGQAEVARIQGEIKMLFADMGINIDQSFRQAFEDLLAKPELYYPDLGSSKTQDSVANLFAAKKREQQIIADYSAIIAEVSAGLDSLFTTIPKVPVVVERIPAFKQATSAAAYYQAASLDGARPGTFFVNLRDTRRYSKLQMRTLSYHEAIPGHHFQISTQQQLSGVPFFRKFLHFTAYVEGWALYAEHLAWELGYQDEPINNIGRLQGELYRAARLVLDTGIHYKRWTKQQAIAYMSENTAIATEEIISEVERYIVMPGQALAYKIGMLKILALRQRAQEKLGQAYNIRDFHRVILENGAMPLSVLDHQVDQYIRSTLNDNAQDSLNSGIH